LVRVVQVQHHTVMTVQIQSLARLLLPAAVAVRHEAATETDIAAVLVAGPLLTGVIAEVLELQDKATLVAHAQEMLAYLQHRAVAVLVVLA
jgi:DUF1365 family protein